MIIIICSYSCSVAMFYDYLKVNAGCRLWWLFDAIVVRELYCLPIISALLVQ